MDFLARRRTMFLVAYLGYAACYLVRNNVAVVSEILARELSWTPTQIGTILSGFTLSYGIGKLVMGIAVDRLSLRHSFSWGLGISALACIAMSFATEPAELVVCLVIIGFVQGGCAPAALAMLGAWYPTQTRGSRVAVWNTSQNLGAAALPLLVSGGLALTGPDNWAIGFWLPGVVALVAAVVVDRFGAERPWQEGLPTLREMFGPDATPQLNIPAETSYWTLVRVHVLGNKVLALLMVLNSLMYLMRFGILNWIPIYQVTQGGLDPNDASVAMSAFEWGAIPGALGFSVIALRWPRRTAAAAAVASAVLVVMVLVYAGSVSADAVIVSAFVLGALVYGPQVIVNILTVNFVSPRAVGVAVGWVGLGGYLVGAVTANLGVPWIADASSWRLSFVLLAATGVACTLVCLRLRWHEIRAARES